MWKFILESREDHREPGSFVDRVEMSVLPTKHQNGQCVRCPEDIVDVEASGIDSHAWGFHGFWNAYKNIQATFIRAADRDFWIFKGLRFEEVISSPQSPMPEPMWKVTAAQV